MRQAGVLKTAGAAALIAACAGLAAAQTPAVKTDGEIPELPPLEDLSATVERPLFTPTRRPPEEAPAPVAEAAPVAVPSEESPADLTGIVSGPDRAYAILTNKKTKEILHLRKGEAIDDWNISEIGPRHVVLRRGPGSLRLELFEEKEPDAAGGSRALTDGERLRRMPANMGPRFAPQQVRRQPQRTRPNRRPNRRSPDE
jgi:hypothetical protein